MYRAQWVHSTVLKELKNIIVGTLSIIFQQSWESGEVPADWKVLNVFSIFKNRKKEASGNYRLAHPASVPLKIIEKFILEVTEKCLRDSAVIGHNQHRFTRERCYLAILISFPTWDKVTHLVDQGKPVCVVFNFSKAFNTVSHSTLDELFITELDKSIILGWVSN